MVYGWSLWSCCCCKCLLLTPNVSLFLPNLTNRPFNPPPLPPPMNYCCVCLSVVFSSFVFSSIGGRRPDTLQKVDVPIIDNNQCQQWYQQPKKNFNLPDSSLCAGFELGGKDSCQVSSSDQRRPFENDSNSMCSQVTILGNELPN